LLQLGSKTLKIIEERAVCAAGMQGKSICQPALPERPTTGTILSVNRPCYLVIDRETSSGISTRKLVIETAKFNVITAYSSKEAIITLKKFPALDGVVLDAGMEDMPTNELIRALKELQPKITVVQVCTPRHTPCEEADHTLETFDPRRLLALLEKLHPDEIAAIEKRNEDLEEDNYRKQ
jgi:response regulator RpfG family c-di-GMP phosphodiesterase